MKRSFFKAAKEVTFAVLSGFFRSSSKRVAFIQKNLKHWDPMIHIAIIDDIHELGAKKQRKPLLDLQAGLRDLIEGKNSSPIEELATRIKRNAFAVLAAISEYVPLSPETVDTIGTTLKQEAAKKEPNWSFCQNGLQALSNTVLAYSDTSYFRRIAKIFQENPNAEIRKLSHKLLGIPDTPSPINRSSRKQGNTLAPATT